jgi:hypothetical protein
MAVILLSCLWAERKSACGRLVFPLALSGLFIVYLALLLRFYKWKGTHGIRRHWVVWFAALPGL